MSQVIRLVTTEAPLTNTNNDIGDQLRLLANRIESGEFGRVKNMLNLFVKDNGRVTQVSFGGTELNSRYVIGMLEEAKVNIFDDLLADSDD